MLASITPLGERGRQSTWGITVMAFGLGAVGAGAAVGALLGALGRVVLPGGDDARWAALLGAVVAAAVADLTARRVPGPRRQVDPGWLDRYRGWVYGAGYGAQLGLGVSTAVTSAATYAALLAALLSRSALGGALIMGVFGLIRGLSPLGSAHVRTTGQLVAVHTVLERWRTRVRPLAGLALGAVAMAALAGVLS